MYVVSFHCIFNENAIILANRLGIPFIQDMHVAKGDIIVVFGAHEQADKLLFCQQQVGCDYILIQSEQFESKVFDNKYYMELLRKNPVLEWSKTNVERLKSKMDIKIYSLYFYDFFGNEKNAISDFNSRPVDFFFCGAHSADRERELTEFKKSNPSSVVDIDFSYSYVNPIEMQNKLKTVKYVINLPFYKNNVLETHRIHRALSAGCEVITVESSDPDMNRKYSPYVHFVEKLTDFNPLLEIEPRGNYIQLMKDFGSKMIEENIRGIRYAEKRIIAAREPKPVEQKEKVSSLSDEFSNYLLKN